MGRASPHARLAPALLLGVVWLPAPPASAQAQSQGLVVRDGSLGNGPPLEVGPGLDPLGQWAHYLITPELGEQRGRNLFHSFERFGIGPGETATFTGPDPIDGPQSVSNVIGRVTGGTRSDIDGRLRSTIPGADLWLFNPKGVVFGEGAQLDVRGSFHAGTGDYLGYAESGERFYADRTQPSVLATAPPAAFGFLGEGGAAPLAVARSALAVPAGKALELVAGDVSITGAELAAPGGHVGLEAQGEVKLSEHSRVDVGGEAPGTISIRSGRLVVKQGSKLLAENESSVPADPEVPGPGSISVDASESVLVDDSLLSVSTSAAGNAGMIYLKSPAVTLQNGPGYFHDFSDPTDPRNQPHPVEVGVSAGTSGGGRGGSIEIEARSLKIRNGVVVSAGTTGGIDGHTATGDAGAIHIDADSMEVLDRSSVSAGIFGPSEGDAGTVEIGVRGTLRVDEAPLEDSTREPGAEDYAFIDTSAYHNVGEPNLGRVPGALGRIHIKAGSAEFLNGARIFSECGGCTEKADGRPPDAAEVRIEADTILVRNATLSVAAWTGGDSGASAIHLIAPRWLVIEGGSVTADTVGGGNAGSITLDAGSVTIGPGGSIGAKTGGAGNGGRIEVHAGSLEVRDGGFINAGSDASGNAGNVEVHAGSLEIRDGGGINAGSGASGNAGSVEVFADTVRIGPGQGAGISVSTFGAGDAGTVRVTATDSIFLTDHGGTRLSLRTVLDVDGTASFTGIFSSTNFGGGGGGSITLEAPEITATEGAIVGTATIEGGAAGDIFLRGDRIRIEKGAFVDSTSLLTEHPAGRVTLEATESIEVVGGHPVFGNASYVASGTTNEGPAGAVTLRAPRIVVADGGSVSSAAVPLASGAAGGAGGDITLDAGRELLVQGGGRVDASSWGPGQGGKSVARAGESLRGEGRGSGIASRTGAEGPGGDVELHAPRIEVASGGEVSALSTPGFGELGVFLGSLGDLLELLKPPPKKAEGNAGLITLAADEVLLTGRGTIATNAATANGGDVRIRAKQLVHLDAGEITASVGAATGGNISIDPVFVILEHGSRISAEAGTGFGGRIRITADNFFAFPGSVVSAASGNPELSGTVEIHSPDVNLAGTLTALPSSFLDAASLMRERCAARRSGERAGSFAVRGPGGIPAEPDGWLPAPLLPEAAATAAGTAARPALNASLPGPLLAHGACP